MDDELDGLKASLIALEAEQRAMFRELAEGRVMICNAGSRAMDLADLRERIMTLKCKIKAMEVEA